MTTNTAPGRQRGAALLIMMLVVLVAATAVLVTRLNSSDTRVQKQTDSRRTLAGARAALLDYAALHQDFSPGESLKLPCPDLNAGGGYAEGEAHTANCGAAGESMLGRLPWRSLGIAPPQDSSSACLWYAVSGSYKEAGAASSVMINPDTNGQMQLYGVESAAIIEGLLPANRPVALIIAPMQGINGQARAASTAAGDQCSSSFRAADFLEADAGTGVSNAFISGAADAIDQFVVASGQHHDHNDRIAVITRADLAAVVLDRHDFNSNMRALGLAVAACIAEYARNNPGGANDRRLPFPAPLSLADYRLDTSYDDTGLGDLSGRLPDAVNDSNAATGNSIAQVLNNCNSAAVPGWTPQMLSMWQNWKDHFFYAVAESYAPTAPVPSACTACLTVNGAGQFAAAIVFAGPRLSSLAQRRDAPPADADTKGTIGNYLEDINAGSFPYTSGSVDFRSQTASATFNDRVFCIDDSLNVSEC